MQNAFFASCTCFLLGAGWGGAASFCAAGQATARERSRAKARAHRPEERRKLSEASDPPANPQNGIKHPLSRAPPLGGREGGDNSQLAQSAQLPTDNASLPCNNRRACIGIGGGGGARRATAPPCVAGGNIIDRRLAASMRDGRRATADA